MRHNRRKMDPLKFMVLSLFFIWSSPSFSEIAWDICLSINWTIQHFEKVGLSEKGYFLSEMGKEEFRVL
jgi:hypothetical protein